MVRGTLPSGTVTFLLTDIEGSTRLWQDRPDLMNAVVARHDELVEAAVSGHDGVLVKSKGEGDSTFSVFARPTDAVAAAAEIQRVLGAEAWPGGIDVAVRAALHTGEAELRDGDYYGTAVNRCARLRAVAHGGQTICSQTTADLVADVLPEGVGVRPLGTHRLKDLERPEQVFQISRADFPEEFPPLRSLDAFRHNLPTQRTSFVGREEELAFVRKLLSDSRLVTLTGVGGCGKTRLSVQGAAEEVDAYADGAYFVDLAPVSDPEAILPVVASSVGMPTSPAGIASGRSLVDDLFTFLGPLEALLVLDNCEHLVDACAELVDDILARCPKVRVLATSREALEVSGERTFSIPSLGVPGTEHPLEAESVRLFEDRAATVRPGFQVTPENGTSVADICRRLDGIPLAIELAAAQVSHLSPHQIAERLSDRFRLLTGGRRRVQRQRTLGAALDWSHDLLSPDEQVLLRRLAAFPGSFTLEAAEAVYGTGGAGRIVELIRSLVSKSLVGTIEEGADLRYRLLETVRLYAEEKLLEAGEADEYRARHRDFYLSWLERFPEGVYADLDVTTLFETEEHNIRAALEWSTGEQNTELVGRLAVAAMPLWMMGGYDEGSRWLDLALDRRDDLDPTLEARVLAAASWVANTRLDGTRMLGFAREALAAGDDLPDVWAIPAHANVALYQSFMGNLGDEEAARESDEHSRRAVELAERATISDRFRNMTHMIRGMCLSGTGQAELALQEFRISLEGWRADAARLTVAALGASRGAYVLHLMGRHDESLAMAQEGTAAAFEWTSTRTTDRGWRVLAAGAEALAFASLGRSRDAAATLRVALEDAGRDRVPGAMGEMLVVLGAIAALAEDWERASRLLAAAGRENVTRSPTTMVLYRHYVPRVRAALDEATARRCREEGFLMPLDEAIEHGLAGIES